MPLNIEGKEVVKIVLAKAGVPTASGDVYTEEALRELADPTQNIVFDHAGKALIFTGPTPN